MRAARCRMCFQWFTQCTCFPGADNGHMAKHAGLRYLRAFMQNILPESMTGTLHLHITY